MTPFQRFLKRRNQCFHDCSKVVLVDSSGISGPKHRHLCGFQASCTDISSHVLAGKCTRPATSCCHPSGRVLSALVKQSLPETGP